MIYIATIPRRLRNERHLLWQTVKKNQKIDLVRLIKGMQMQMHMPIDVEGSAGNPIDYDGPQQRKMSFEPTSYLEIG